jgi:two-component system phosphate regulon sensor histidine kinase PhoR
MRRKLSWLNSLILLLSLFLIMLVSCFIVSGENTKASERSLANYLTLGKGMLKENCQTQTLSEAASSGSSLMTSSAPTLRITVISETGSVIIDTFKDNIEENHLDRPEIKNLGTICYRYSSTLKKNMMYLASLDSYTDVSGKTSQCYFRVAMPQYDVNMLVNNFVLYGSLSALGIFFLSFFANWYLTKKAVAPLKEQADKLGQIAGKPLYAKKGDEVEIISKEIEETKKLIQSKMDSVTFEKEKLSFVLNSVGQGILVCSGSASVLLINAAGEKIFDKKESEILGQPFLRLSIDPKLNEALREALEEQKKSELEIEGEDKRTYLVVIEPLSEAWCRESGHNGAGMSLTDITSEKNLAQSKRDFFANASHELKSPLTSISGYCQLIRDGMVTDPKEQQEILDRVLFETNRMNEIIIQMLELSRLESQTQTELTSFDLAKGVLASFASVRLEAEKRHIALALEGDDFAIRIGEEDGKELISNLVENAVRYNKDGGKVTVEISSKKKTVSVFDTGIGIPQEDLGRIFERFFRVDKAKSRKLGGTGLGLSIVKHICLNEGISIAVESTLGEGSTFTLTFSK